MMWGSNVPVTRTPDAHWMAEARYRGQKVVVVSPDYADNVKFADEWLPAQPGTDGALAMAMGHVILKEFFVERTTPRFVDYVSRYTDLPYLVALEPVDGGGYRPGKFLTAADLGETDAEAAFRPALWDSATDAVAVPERVAGPPVQRRRRRPVEPRPRRDRRPGSAATAAAGVEVAMPAVRQRHPGADAPRCADRAGSAASW